MIHKQTFTIAGSEGKPILMDLTSAENNEALVIFVHGFKGFKDWGTHDQVAKIFAGKGINFLKFNFSHNGTTPESPLDFTDLEAFGNNTFSKELFDLDQVITFAEKSKELSGSTGNICLIGHSLGGGISIVQSAEDKRIRKLVTWASVSRFRNLWMNDVEPIWRKEGVIYVDNIRTGQKMPLKVELLKDLEQNYETLDILSAAQKVEQPWLIIHGSGDSIVPVEQAQELNRQQSQSKLLIINNADHVFEAKHPWLENSLPANLNTVVESTVSFFKQQ